MWKCKVMYGNVWSNLSTACPKFPSCILFEICDVVIMLVVKVQQKENRDYRENLKNGKTSRG